MKIFNANKNLFGENISRAGFTLIEIIITVTILLILAAVVIPNFVTLNKLTELNNSAREVGAVLTLARSRTLVSENTKKYGVYFDLISFPNTYTLFRGDSYEAREVSADRKYYLPQVVEFYGNNLIKSSDDTTANEVVFNRLTGLAEEHGDLSLRLKADESQVKTIYVSASGTIGFVPFQAVDDAGRIKDSRDIKFNYNRVINTSAEDIVLDFNNGGTTYVISIIGNLLSGELDWEGVVNVGGTDQAIRIHTSGMGTVSTLFSVRRDRRYNDAALKITISGDAGYLVNYSADGGVTDFSSIYVDQIQWQ